MRITKGKGIEQRLKQQMEEYKLDLIQDLACLLEARQNNNLNGSFYVRVGEKVMEFNDKRRFVHALVALNRPAIVYGL